MKPLSIFQFYGKSANKKSFVVTFSLAAKRSIGHNLLSTRECYGQYTAGKKEISTDLKKNNANERNFHGIEPICASVN